MPFRVLVVCSANLSIGGGTSIRARLLTQGLQECGATVAVIAAGVPESFHQLGITFFPAVNYKDYFEAIVAVGESFNPDIVFGITEAFADNVINASKRLNCPCVFDIHGIGIFEILELGSGFGPRWQRLRNSFRWLKAMRNADVLLVSCPTLLPIIGKFHHRTIYVPGVVDVDHFNPDGPKITLGDPRRTQVLYAGNFLVWQGCNLLLQAADILLTTGLPYEFTFIGTFGRNESLLRTWEKWISTGYFHFIGLVEYETIPTYLRSADILTIPRPFLLSTYFAFPNKLGDYMASGRAILATNLKPHQFAIRDAKNGILCHPTPSSIAKGLLRLQDEQLRNLLGKNARVTAEEHYNAKQVSGFVYSVLQDIIG